MLNVFEPSFRQDNGKLCELVCAKWYFEITYLVFEHVLTMVHQSFYSTAGFEIIEDFADNRIGLKIFNNLIRNGNHTCTI